MQFAVNTKTNSFDFCYISWVHHPHYIYNPASPDLWDSSIVSAMIEIVSLSETWAHSPGIIQDYLSVYGAVLGIKLVASLALCF